MNSSHSIVFKSYLPERDEVFLRDVARFFAGRPEVLRADFFALFFADFFALFFEGTFAPFLRASDNPMAIACFRLVTFLPDRPDVNDPFFFLRIALATVR